MVCSSKWCGWLQTISQLIVAIVFLYTLYVTSIHISNISRGVAQVSHDIHLMQESVSRMNNSMTDMNNELHTVNKQLNYMSSQVGGVRRKLSPFRMFSPF